MGNFFFFISIFMAFIRGKDILVYGMKKKQRENTLAIHSAKEWGKENVFDRDGLRG